MKPDIWLGMAVVLLTSSNERRSEGYVGGFVNFACKSSSIHEAVSALSIELAESGFELVGLESVSSLAMFARELTALESSLVTGLDAYPIQLGGVHVHKGDG